MTKQFLFFIAFIVCISNVQGQNQQLNWVSLEKAEQLNKKEPKKIFLFFHTNWCGVCKTFEKKILKSPIVIEQLNNDYYPVKFNGEQKESVTFDGVTYKYVSADKSRGANQFAIDVLQGQLAFPSIVILEEDYDPINIIRGLQPKELFEQYLSYISSNAYLTQEWFDYSKQEEPKE